MKKYSKAIIVLFIAAAGVFILKNAGFIDKLKEADFIGEPIETLGASEEATTSSATAPSEVSLRAVGDIDCDGTLDTVIAHTDDEFDWSPFNIYVIWGDGRHTEMQIDSDCLSSISKLYLVDITGDDRLDIVMPDLGHSDTRGSISTLIMTYSDGTFKELSLFDGKFFNRTYTTYCAEKQLDADNRLIGLSVVSLPSGNVISLPFIYDVSSDILPADPDSIENVFVDTWQPISGDVVRLPDGTWGLKFLTAAHYGFYMESDETVETIRLGDGYIYAFIKYRNGVWSVVDEFFSENFFSETEAALEPDQRQILAIESEGVFDAWIFKFYSGTGNFLFQRMQRV